MAELVNTIGQMKYDGLIGGIDPQLITRNVIIASGAGQLPPGIILGKVTASKKYVSVDSTQKDGSQIASCILANEVDATNSDVVATVFWSGMFNRESLSCGGTDTVDQHEDELRNIDILLTSQK